MMPILVGSFWIALAVYAVAGLVVTTWRGRRGLAQFDPGAGGGSFGFLLVVLTAAVALWPLLLAKERARVADPPNPERPLPPTSQRRLHGTLVLALLVLVPITCGLALWLRPPPPVPTPVKLPVSP